MKFLVADVTANPGETVSDDKQPRFVQFLQRLFGGGDKLKPAQPAPPARKNRQSHAPKPKPPAAKKEPPSDKPAKQEPPSNKPAKKEPPSRDKPAKKVAAKLKAGTKPKGPPPAAPAEAPGKVPPHERPPSDRQKESSKEKAGTAMAWQWGQGNSRQARGVSMSKLARGTKRVCPSCGARFYDLNRAPIVCPVCQYIYQMTPPPPSSRRWQRAQPVETKKVEEQEAKVPVLEGP